MNSIWTDVNEDRTPTPDIFNLIIQQTEAYYVPHKYCCYKP